MKGKIELKIHGIKCDECSFEDKSVKVEDYPNWVNKPCPECGANLLTEADFEATQGLQKIVGILNFFLPKRADTEDEKQVKYSGQSDGMGRIKFERDGKQEYLQKDV